MSHSPALDSPLSVRYPIGQPSESQLSLSENIAAIAALPKALREALSGLSETQLETPYRDGGWTVRQLAHHVADSHMNAYVRFRLALTEEWPTIKPYEQERWAELADARTLPAEVSLALLEPLHVRWAAMLNSLGEAEWRRGYVHPESGRQTLDSVAALYSWHGRHHTAHVTELRRRMGW